MEITLYSTDCPRCKILEKKLSQKNIDFKINKNIDEINSIATKYGFTSAPLLKVGEQLLEFGQANKFINDF